MWWWVRNERRFPRPLTDGPPHSPENRGIEDRCNTQVPQIMWKQINMKWKSAIKVKINEFLKFKISPIFFHGMGNLSSWLKWCRSWMRYWESRCLCHWAAWAYDSSSPAVLDLSWSLWVCFSRHFCLDLEGNARKSHTLDYSGDLMPSLLCYLCLYNLQSSSKLAGIRGQKEVSKTEEGKDIIFNFWKSC